MKVSIILLASGQVGKCLGHPFLNFPEPPLQILKVARLDFLVLIPPKFEH